ncbi:MAG: homocysteine S-methyltransferase family protein [Thermodesulfobacteriota bacterium]
MSDFRRALADGRILLFDGAMGTMLQSRGMPAGASPERFGLSAPDVLEAVHREYLSAGARVLTTNTFGGTAHKLGPDLDPADFNRQAAAAARRAAGDAAFVAGSVGPTGLFCRPLGDVSFRDMVEAFRRQIAGLAAGGADFILAETHYDLAEVRAVVVACREVGDLPVGVSMTFESGAALTGASPLTFLDAVQNLGVDLVGVNCGAGPETLGETVRAMLPRLSTPLLVQPNAGLPELVDGRTVFRLGPQEFAAQTAALADLGVKALGGCCGTSPAHIAALAAALRDRGWSRPEPAEGPHLALTSRSESALAAFHRPCLVIGERINPTGKKVLTAELQEGRFSEAHRLAREQAEAGAGVLDVNVGAPLVDETVLLPALVESLSGRIQAPLCLDSTKVEAVAAALDVYPGSPLVNSISGEPGRMEVLGPLCKRYGAPFILLPLEGKKLPVTAAERLAVIESLLRQAEDLGIPRRLILVDALVLTVSSKPESAKACLEVITHCREQWGLPTVMGLSNVSFGLPARELVNATFLAMAMARGLAAVIANPSTPRIAEALAAGEVLLARDPSAGRFIAGHTHWKSGEAAAPAARGAAGPARASTLAEAVLLGLGEDILPMLEAALAEGADPFALVREQLIPGITSVGEKYERKEYFLPQLLQSAETMQIAFARLKPLLEAGAAEAGPVVVLATVEGDIHDIGKNIVALMLRNHGFTVVDLGKDVPAARIVAAAEEHGAALIGLSALMTTTMVRMAETVDLVREKGLAAKVLVGGAVLSEAYAARIGADGYAQDAVAAVRLAGRLCGMAP